MQNVNKIIELFGERFFLALKQCPLSAGVLEEIIEPKRVVSTRIKLTRSGQDNIVTRGWRLCLSDIFGPSKGGVRFHPEVNPDNLLTLAARIFLKCAVNDLPHGGAAGGIAIEPKELSPAELESLSRSYVRAFADIIGAERDILSPDLGTGATVMGWMSDELSVIRGRHEPAAINGKPPGLGGIPGRHGATAHGVWIALREAFLQWQWEPSELNCSIQGLGEAGGTLAEQLHREGIRVVAVSDSSGGWHSSDGLDVPEICRTKRAGIPLAKMDVKQADKLEPLETIEVPADIVVAAALGEQIDVRNAPRMRCRAVIEVANAAVTDEAGRHLEEQGVKVLPDVVVNAGGITVSHLEWAQNRTGRLALEQEVREQLETRMTATTRKLFSVAQDYEVSLPVAAQILAIEKLKLVFGA